MKNILYGLIALFFVSNSYAVDSIDATLAIESGCLDRINGGVIDNNTLAECLTVNAYYGDDATIKTSRANYPSGYDMYYELYPGGYYKFKYLSTYECLDSDYPTLNGSICEGLPFVIDSDLLQEYTDFADSLGEYYNYCQTDGDITNCDVPSTYQLLLDAIEENKESQNSDLGYEEVALDTIQEVGELIVESLGNESTDELLTLAISNNVLESSTEDLIESTESIIESTQILSDSATESLNTTSPLFQDLEDNINDYQDYVDLLGTADSQDSWDSIIEEMKAANLCDGDYCNTSAVVYEIAESIQPELDNIEDSSNLITTSTTTTQSNSTQASSNAQTSVTEYNQSSTTNNYENDSESEESDEGSMVTVETGTFDLTTATSEFESTKSEFETYYNNIINNNGLFTGVTTTAGSLGDCSSIITMNGQTYDACLSNFSDPLQIIADGILLAFFVISLVIVLKGVT